MGLIALAAGLAAPMSTPVAGPLDDWASEASSASSARTVGEHLARRLAEPDADADLVAFYAERWERPIWVTRGRLRPEARQLIRLIKGATADGLKPAAYQPEALQQIVDRAADGGAEDLAAAELALSKALASWASDLHKPQPGAGLIYSDPDLKSPVLSRRAVLETVADAPSLRAGLAKVTRMNPLYVRLRTALAEEKAREGPNVALIRANLERARALPSDLGRRYIFVDIVGQTLWAYEDGRPVDNMKVVVGKAGDPTPPMAALVRYAVFRPYWNVPTDLVAKSTAPKVLKQGLTYFRDQRLEALSNWSDEAEPVDPEKVDWSAVAAGKMTLRVRQLPGPENMMGQVKFMFPNDRGVYLHDTPLRGLFTEEARLRSAGCVRLEDATRLARWLVGEEETAAGQEPGPPETRVDLAEPTPVYLVYFTALPTEAGLSLRKDVYGRDPPLIARLQGQPPQTRVVASAAPRPAQAAGKGAPAQKVRKVIE